METLIIIDGDPLLFRSAWKSENVEEAKSNFEEGLQDILNSCFAEDYRIAVFGDTNYRKDVDSSYKSGASRAASKEKNPNYFKLRRLLLKEGRVEEAVSMEADDYVRIWAEEARAEGRPFVVASIDKDLQCIAGTHYLIHRRELKHVSEEEADIHYWTQVLTGDSVDNIPGIYGIGPKKAEKILEGAETSTERKQRVIDAYFEHFNEYWKEAMMLTGQLIHIKATLDDRFQLEEEDGPSAF